MRLRQILVTLHFQEAASRSLKLEIQLATSIDSFQRLLRRNNQLHITIIEFIDHIDKATGLVISITSQLRHIGYQYRMIFSRQLNIVVLRARPVTQIQKLKPDHIFSFVAGGNWAPLHFHFDTLQNLDNLHEGVYIDDIQVVPRCVGGCCTSDVECQGLPLEDGCSQAKCIELDGGAGNVCAAVPTKPGELCQPCSDDAECSDGNPCTADTCSEAGTCEYAVFCCFEENAFATSFEEPLTDFYVGDSNPNDGVGWKLTGQSAALGFSSAWIADEATSTYDTGETVDVSLTTPTFNLPANSEVAGTLGLAFWLNLSTEWDGQQYSNPAGIDRLSVSVVQGPVSTEVWSSDAIGGSTGGIWQPIEVELGQWAEAPIQIRFSFKSGDAVNNAFVGPIIDAIKVGRICPLE